MGSGYGNSMGCDLPLVNGIKKKKIHFKFSDLVIDGGSTKTEQSGVEWSDI